MHPLQRKIIDIAGAQDINSLSRSQLADMLGVTHRSHVQYHLQQLMKQGILRNISGRGLRVNPEFTYGPTNFWQMPIINNEMCDDASVFADGHIDGYIRVSHRYARPTSGWYALRFIGDSMNRANIKGETIEEGDFAVINPHVSEPETGDCVLAVIDKLPIIRCFHRETSGKIVLSSESSSEYEPIYVHPDDPLSSIIAGKVECVLKKTKIKMKIGKGVA